jgi:hypothetical protein
MAWAELASDVAVVLALGAACAVAVEGWLRRGR